MTRVTRLNPVITGADLTADLAASSTYRVSDYNLKGDWAGGDANGGTGTNDTAALNTLVAAVPAGSTIVFDGSKTYRLDPLTTITKTLTLDFDGAHIVTKTMSAGVLGTAHPLIHFESPFGTEYAVATGAVARGATTVTTATHANAGNFAAKDYVMIYGAESLPAWNDPGGAVALNAYRGEVNTVTSVNATTGVVTLESPISHNHAADAAIKIRKIATPNISPTVKNVGLVIDTDPGGGYTGSYDGSALPTTFPNLFSAYGCIDPLFENIKATSWQGFLTYFKYCLRPRLVDVEGRDPLRPATAGHGYVNRMEYCVDGLAERCRGIRARHLVDQVGSSRCGSRGCYSYTIPGGIFTSFFTHGHGSHDTFSIDDTVVNGNGWCLGHTEFTYDYGFKIVRPTYFGDDVAIRAQAGSTGLRVSEPNLHTSAGAPIGITSLADDTVIDARMGVLESTHTDPAAISVFGASPEEFPGDVTVYGSPHCFVGDIYITMAGKLTLRDIPANVSVFISDVGERDFGAGARNGTTVSSATPTPAVTGSNFHYTVTALAAGATFGAPTGSPQDGWKMTIRVKDNATARSLAFNSIYRAVGVTLPTTTVISKTLYLDCIYNRVDNKWDVVAVRQEA